MQLHFFPLASEDKKQANDVILTQLPIVCFFGYNLMVDVTITVDLRIDFHEREMVSTFLVLSLHIENTNHQLSLLVGYVIVMDTLPCVKYSMCFPWTHVRSILSRCQTETCRLRHPEHKRNPTQQRLFANFQSVSFIYPNLIVLSQK